MNPLSEQKIRRRIALSADVGTDPQTIDSAGREILDQDINLLHQLEEQFPALVRA